MEIDYLIVGSGLTGAVIARELHDKGFRVLIVERRSHVGGNVHDFIDSNGIRIHTYGPHYFRTSSDKIWNFVNRFSDFYHYAPSLFSRVDGQLENWPIHLQYIEKTIGKDWSPAFKGEPLNFEEACLSIMPKQIYEKFVKGYTEKQWGVDAKTLEASLASRFDVRVDPNDTQLKNSKYQGIPWQGYSHFMSSLLAGIPIWLNFDYLKYKDYFQVKELTIFTGPIDELFENCFGKLQYRGQKREHQFFKEHNFIQSCGQVNNPGMDSRHVRTLEWKYMMEKAQASIISGTVLTTETPFTPSDPNEYEYPFPSSENKVLYLKYKELADSIEDLLVCGRLGEYKYYDMDQAIGRAFTLCDRILKLREIKVISKTEKIINATTKILS